MHPHPEALYYHIAQSALAAARRATDEFDKKQQVAVAMVFSALCLEAFVNQQWPGPKRKPLREKWLKLPSLLCSKQTFNCEAEPFSTFEHLVKTRNSRLVHFHPAGETDSTDAPVGRRYFGDLVGDVVLADRYVRCVESMITKLHELTGGLIEIPSFLTGDKYLSSVWSSCTVAYEALGPGGRS